MSDRAIENALTNVGKNLLRDSIYYSRPVVFSRVELGTGMIEEGASLAARTSLIEPYAEATIAKKRALVDGQMSVSVQFLNTSVTSVVNIREIGIFAKLGANGSTPAQSDLDAVLFSYMTFGDYPDLILPSDVAAVQRVYDIPFIFSGNAQVAVTISPSGIITNEDVTTTGGTTDPSGESQVGKVIALNENGKLHVDIEGDAQTLGGKSPNYFVSAEGLAEHIGAASGDKAHAVATPSANGFMSSDDKSNMNTMTGGNGNVQALKTEASPTFAGLTVNGYIDGAMFR